MNFQFRKEEKSYKGPGLVSMECAALAQSCILLKTVSQKVLRSPMKKSRELVLTHLNFIQTSTLLSRCLDIISII